ncbi:hypothetical protein J9303_02080 [Bacillaceae bacterium Marseille-Q3522]|nr:hypothetical protein [Bacillaceae bacterium Marseille-Q3522]
MILAQIINQILKKELPAHGETNTAFLRNGQLLTGKITKLFSNQQAEVQVGAHKILAKLEAPVTLASRYWFQVQDNQGQLYLKVIDIIGDNNGKAAELLDLPIEKENIALVRLLLKNNFLISKENLSSASKWLTASIDRHRSLETIKTMLEAKLPFHEHVYKALFAVQKGESLPMLMDKLQNILKQETLNHSGNQLLHLLSELTVTGEEKAVEIALKEVLKDWILNKDDTAFALLKELGILKRADTEINVWKQLRTYINDHNHYPAVKDLSALMETILSSDKEKIIRGFLPLFIRLLEQEGGDSPIIRNSIPVLKNFETAAKKEPVLLQAEKTLRTVIQVLSGQQQQDPVPAMKSLLSSRKAPVHPVKGESSLQAQETERQVPVHLQNTWKVIISELYAHYGRTLSDKQIISLIKSAIAAFLQVQENPDDVLMKEILPFIKNKIENQSSLMYRLENLKDLGEKKWFPLFTEIISMEKEQLEQPMQISKQLKMILQKLGMSYDYHLQLSLEQNTDINGKLTTDNLKSLLMQYIKDSPSPAGKENAEHLLHKITGYQILSQEAGPIQHFVYQIPFRFWKKTIDVSMQWSGRKLENGKIDPNYCRVIFYLQLERLKETVIDMQVQNRVINLQIMNHDHELKRQALPFLAMLKENLSRLRYTLSSVQFSELQEESGPAAQAVQADPLKAYHGVDMKI